MNKIDILHIYAGTSGSAGLYIDSIYTTLKSNFNQYAIVSYYFPFKYGRKLFYKYSDLAHAFFFHRSNILRLTIRYFELLFALTYSLIFILFRQPRIINYSLTTQINIEYYFLKIIKVLSNGKMWITAHDVIPFQTNYSKYEKSLTQRRRFFLMADKVIVHNTNSTRDLYELYKIDQSKILYHPFPIMDLRNLEIKHKVDNQLKTYFKADIKTFVFVGHLRKEKGINILIGAWEKLITSIKSHDNIQLIIAGNTPNGFFYDFSNIPNLILLNNFLSDSDYKFIIENAECVILPYTKGTNSGIPSSVITLKTKLITSNIPMFHNNELIDKDFIFESENIPSLVEKMKSIINDKSYDFNLVSNYQRNFEKTITAIYKKYII